MKKKGVAVTDAPILPSVVERAEGIRRRGKRQRMPASAEMPAVEVIKLDSTRTTGDASVQFAAMQASKVFAWMRVIAALDELARDPGVNQDSAAIEFVKVMAAIARAAPLADSAEEALLPVDGLLPAGRLGEKSSAAHSVSASSWRTVSPADVKSVRRKYTDRLRAGERYGAIRDLSKETGHSETTIRTVVEDLIPKKSHK